MKILIIGFNKLKYMPYMNFYMDNIDKKNHEVHVLYWNRDCKQEVLNHENVIYHEFSCYQEDDVNKLFKIKSFLKFKKFVKKNLKSDIFDRVIFLHTLPGILLYKFLVKNYKNKYIYDFRDITYEKNWLFRSIVGKLVKNSYATFVSSSGFKKYLPNCNNIYISHNILEDSLQHRLIKKELDNDVIKLSFWGFIRHLDINKELIKKLCNNEKFEIHYYGRIQNVAKELMDYSKSINCNNVFFHGEYVPEDRYEFVKHANLIHNLYYDENMLLAMANKFYDGIIFYIPQICYPGSHMGQISVKNGVGFECSPYENNFPEKIYNYYKNIHWEEFAKNCDNLLDNVLEEYNAGIKIIKNFVEE